MTPRYAFAGAPITAAASFVDHPHSTGLREDRSSPEGKGVAAGIAVGFVAGLVLLVLAPVEGTAAAVTVVAGSMFIGGAAGYAGVVIGQSTSDSSGGEGANQGSSDQGPGNQGSGNQGSGNQGSGNQGTGDQGTGSTGDSAGGIGGGCFPAGTPILLADGSYRSIEAMQAGDLVVSQDFDSGHVAGQPVLKVFRHQVSSMIGIQFTDGTSLQTTKQHRFYVPEKGFVAAGTLEGGSTVVTHDNRYPVVRDVRPLHGDVPVYNLEVANSHTFFVGNQGIWVHNLKDDEDEGE